MYLNDKSKTDEQLALMKEKLKLLNLKSKPDEYLYFVFKLIEKYFNDNCSKPNVGYVEGIKFIVELLQMFISNDYKPYNTHFFNNEKKSYIEVYTIYRNHNIHYFAYQQDNKGIYKLNEVGKEQIKFYISNYESMRSYNLNISEEPKVKTYSKTSKQKPLLLMKENGSKVEI